MSKQGKSEAQTYVETQLKRIESDANGTMEMDIRNTDFSEAKTTNGKPLFQYRAIVEDEDTYRDMLYTHKKAIGISDTDIDNLFNLIDETIEIVAENLEILDYAWETDIDDRAFMPVKPNSDSLYKVSLDFSTLCRKRLLQQTIQAALQEALNKPLSKEESIAIRDELLNIQEEGRQIEVACALCYVESARMKSPVQINKFINNKENIIREFFANRSGGDIKEKIKAAEAKARNELKKANPNGMKGKNDKDIDVLTSPLSHMSGKDAEYIREAKRKAKLSYKLTAHEQAELDVALSMSVSDFTSAEGLENLARNHEDLFDAYTSYIRNATHSKGLEGDTWWRAGDSDLIGDNLIQRMNEENGLRSQSWSDFQVIHLLDYIAATIELSAKGAKRQSYTKVPDYVKLLGNTGDMINMSLIPTRAFTGKLEYDPVEGMAYEIAKELRDKYHETVGTICIGMDNEQIKMLLADATIDMVIPYHKSSMSKAVRKLMHIPKWNNYEEYQQEKRLSDSEAKANAKKYGVSLVKDENYQKAPKFSEWFDLEEARQIAKMENDNPSDAQAYKKYGIMYGGYMAMQNAANNYLKLCAQRGLSPKFSHENANFTQEANYWKLLIDRKMIDNITGEVIEQKAIKPIFNQNDVLDILNDELARYPSVKADQDYATRKVTEKFLSGEIEVDESTTNAIKTTVDNVAKVNILESGKELKRQYSEREIIGESGTNYGMGVYLDDNLLTGLTDSERIDMVKEYVKELGGNYFTAYDNNGKSVSIHIAEHHQKFKNSNGNKKRVTTDLTSYLNNKTKQEAIVLVDELITNASYDTSAKPKYPHDWLDDNGKNDWEYWTVFIQEKNKTVWEATLNIANSSNGEKILYDIYPIKMVEQSVTSDTSTTKDSIPQTPQIVKRQNSDRQQSILTGELYDLMGENEKLKSRVEILTADIERWKERLKMEGKVTNGQYFRTSTLENLAGHLRKKYNSSIGKAALTDMLRDLTQIIHNLDSSNMTADQLLNEHLLSIAYAIAEDMSVKPTLNEEANAIIKAIRDEKVVITEDMIGEFQSIYDKRWNSRFFGKINVSKGDVSNVDEVYARLREQYPSVFPDIAADGDMLPTILDVYDRTKDAMYIEEQFNVHEVAMDIAREIYTQAWNLAPTRTVADRYTEKIKALKVEHNKAMSELTQTYKDRIDKQKLADDMYYGRIINNIRKRDEMALNLAKKRGVEKLDKYKENALRKTRLQRITANVKALERKLVKNTKDEHIPEVIKPVIESLISAMNFSTKKMLRDGLTPSDVVETEKQLPKGYVSKENISLYKAIENVKDMLSASNSELWELAEVIDNKEIKDLVDSLYDIKERLGDNEFILKNMTNEQIESLDYVIRMIKNYVSQINEYYATNWSKGAIAHGAETVRELKARQKIFEKDKVEGEKHLDALKTKTLWNSTNPFYAFKRFGEAASEMFRSMMDGQDRAAFLSKEVIEETEKIYTSADLKKWRKKYFTFEIMQNNGKTRKFSMNVPQIMALYCTAKQEDGKNHILNGYQPKNDSQEESEKKGKGRGITLAETNKKNPILSNITLTEKDLDTIISKLNTLPKSQKGFTAIEVADKLQSYMATRGAELGNEISMRRWGIKAFGIKDYFPIKVSKGQAPGKDSPSKGGNPLVSLLNMAFTHARTRLAPQSIEIGDIFDVYSSHMADMIRYNAFALPVLDMYKWMNYKGYDDNGIEVSVETAITEAFGKDAWIYLDKFMKDVNGSTEADNREKISLKFIKNSKIAKVGANLRVAALQFTSYIRAGAVMDNKYLLKALDLRNLARMKGSEKALKYCGIALWKSLGYYDTDITQSITEKITHNKSVHGAIVELSMKGAELADKATWGVLWNACELEIRDKRKDLKIDSPEYYQAISDRLRDVIYQTQVVDSVFTRSHIMRSKGTWDKILTAFASESALSFNLITDAFISYELDKRSIGKKAASKKNGKYIRKTIIAYTVTAMATSLLGGAFDALRDDDEEEKDAAYYAMLFGGNFLLDLSIINKLPYFNMFYSVIQGFTPGRTDADWMTELSKAVTYFLNGKNSKALIQMAKFVSDATGIPIYNLLREVMTVYNNID